MRIKLEDILSAVKAHDTILYDAIVRASKERENKDSTCSICGSKMDWLSEQQFYECPKCGV